MSKPINMRIMEIVDLLFQGIPLMFALVGLLVSIYKIAVDGLYSVTSFELPIIGAFSVSSIIVVLYTSFYIYTFYQLNYLLAPVRVVVTLAYTMLGMGFTKLIFSTTLSIATIYACTFFIICVVLWFYNRQHGFFQFPFSFVVLVIYYAFMTMVFIKSPPQYYLSSFLMRTMLKYIGVWLWVDLYQSRGVALRNIKSRR